MTVVFVVFAFFCDQGLASSCLG